MSVKQRIKRVPIKFVTNLMIFMGSAIKKAYLDDKIEKLTSEFSIGNGEAFLQLIYSSLFDTDIEDIDEADIIEGSQEKQIDIIKILEEDENLSTVNIIQCKFEEGFSSNSLICLKNGLDWIFNKPKEEYQSIGNKRLVQKIKEIRELRQNIGLSNMTVNVYFITAGDTQTYSAEFKQELTAFENYKNSGYRGFNTHIWGVDEFVNHLNKIESSDKIIDQDIKIVYDVNQPSVMRTNRGGYTGVICSVRATELVRLIEEDQKGVIFNKNIRRYLGSHKKISRTIYDACSSSDSKLFWFLNNGITIVCDKVDFIPDPDNPHVKVKNLQIVNGCQTSMTLLQAKSDGKLMDETVILVRIYATDRDDPKFTDKITISTNNQNKIGARDLKANEPIQVELQRLLRERYGYYYERKINEFRGQKIDSKKKIVNEKIAQSYLAVGKKMPSIAKSHPEYTWSKDEYYDMVFAASTAAQLLFCYKLYEYCNAVKKKKMNEYQVDENLYSTVAYGLFHIARVMGYLYLKQEHLPSDAELEDHIKNFEKEPSMLEAHYLKSIKILNSVLEENQSSFVSPTNYYKSNAIHEKINRKLASIKF